MLHLYFATIPHAELRYPTVGDYWETNTADLLAGASAADPSLGLPLVREVRVSQLGNEDYEFLVAIHELIEQHLCKKRGIPEAKITAFDMLYEQSRPAGDTSEPGNDTRAPYYHEHQFATSIELQIAAALEVDWAEYDKTVNSL